MLWQYPHEKYVYVCKRTRQIHHCGHQCTHRVVSMSLDSEVCSLTGMVIGGALEVHYVRQSREHYGSGPPKLIGNNKIRMDRRQNRMVVHKPKKSHKPHIHKIIKHVLTGTARQQQYHKALHDLFVRDVLSESRRALGPQGIPFVALQARLNKVYTTHRAMITAPLPPRDPRIDVLATAIHRYWEKMTPQILFSIKNITAFTATCLTKLRDGCTIGGITVFPRVPWMAQHTPADIQFKDFDNLQCRNMSFMWRKMLHVIVCPTTQVPRRQYLFEPV